MLGRRAERDAVEQLLTAAASGVSGVLVVRGEAGIGKSALLDHARGSAVASGFRVETSTGMESETQFAFAGLHQLCAPLLNHADVLPDPQGEALGVALGQRAGAAPDRFLVGLATLNLLAEAAEEAPILCLIDDAQWIDEASAQVLAFVARRVVAEQIALVFAVRNSTNSEPGPFDGLAELRVTALDDGDARSLLASAVHTSLDDRVRDQIVAEARGNPLALLELPLGARPAQLAGGFELPDAPSVPRRVEDAFVHRSVSLPPDAQLLLLVAAADPTGDVALLWRAAAHLGVSSDAAAPAESAGLLEIDSRVRFRHPLARSAVYQAATPPDRRRAHDALAAVTDPKADPDRRAWHRAQAVQGPDGDAAAELERSAQRARARGGSAASAAFLEQAAALTPEPGLRASRALEAAHSKHEAGAFAAAMELLTVAAVGPLDALQHARLELLRSQITFHLTRGNDVPGMLLDAAKALAPLDAALSRETYLHALEAAMITGGSSRGHGVGDVAKAASDAPAPPGPPGPMDLLLDGLVMTATHGQKSGVPGLRRALEAFRDEVPPPDAGRGQDSRRWLWLASRTAVALFEDDLAYELAGRNVRLAREAGALASLPAALTSLSVTLVLAGELTHASELNEEETAIRLATGAEPMRNRAQLIMAGWRGRQDGAEGLDASGAPELFATRPGTGDAIGQYALAVLYNGLGNYPGALDAAGRACESDELLNGSMALPELIEAAVRAGQPERAITALERLSSLTSASGTQWALGLEARSRALTSAGPGAEEHYREAIERLGECRMATHFARTHLVYGEWLRREGRRQDAREQLRTAHELLSDMGAEAFAARAALELRATGEHPRKRRAQPIDELTAHEVHIARLVATGATSREVGTQLFLSPRTIEAHLRSIFRKLEITSRRQLRDIKFP
ncbi:MAG: LuxR family transcriptional regulator [Microthrixaceae bacterium]